jgi:hypothetical protein
MGWQVGEKGLRGDGFSWRRTHILLCFYRPDIRRSGRGCRPPAIGKGSVRLRSSNEGRPIEGWSGYAPAPGLKSRTRPGAATMPIGCAAATDRPSVPPFPVERPRQPRPKGSEFLVRGQEGGWRPRPECLWPRPRSGRLTIFNDSWPPRRGMKA